MNLFTPEQESYIQHEVKIRMLEGSHARFEETFKSIDNEFKQLRKENLNHFVATIGILVTLFGAMILTKIFT